MLTLLTITMRMPAAEVAITVDIVRALLREQHPDLAGFPLVDAGEGWDNRQVRLGAEFVVRLPRRQVAAALIEHEQQWLPVIAPRLPLPVPVPVRLGRPGCGFPWPWSITPWFEGQVAVTANANVSTSQLGQFLCALHQPAPPDAPHNPFRTSLASRSEAFEERASQFIPGDDRSTANAVWYAALSAHPWEGPAVWLHGDLHPANLILNEGRLRAVIDFGDLTAGDPAVDLAVAWMLWGRPARERFRTTVDGASFRMDDAAWQRARGWALSLGLAYLANSEDNLMMETIGRRTVAAVLADPLATLTESPGPA